VTEVTEVTERSDAEVLRAALDWLGGEGERWVQHTLVFYESGTLEPARVCAEGAVRIALWGDVGMREDGAERARLERICRLFTRVAVEQFPDIVNDYSDPVRNVPEFNDNTSVSFGEVRVVFEKAIAEARDE
jgi:hypothetical protein